jgi:arylesterase / paraoxonase
MTLGKFSAAFVLAAISLCAIPAAARDCVHVAVTAGEGGAPLMGVEDIVIDRAGAVAYLSVDDRRKVADEIADGAPHLTQGGIYALSVAALSGLPARAAAVPLTEGFRADFHPHGIDLYEGPDGATLFAVNHRVRPASEHTVEIFDLAVGTLAHRETLRSALLVSPNDLAADGRRAFYLTNDHGATSALGRAIEDVTGRGRGDVVRYDGTAAPGARFRVIATGIAFANGIALDRARRKLYIASSRDEAVLEYDLARGGFPRTAPDRAIPVGIGPDNLSLAPDGALIVAGHPSLLRFVLYALTGGWRFGVRTAPSAVLRLAGGAITPLYGDDGDRLSASTVGVVAGGLLLVGSVFDSGIVACRL